MPEDRRLAAIMFTDIVGYTALMGKDEDRAFHILRKNRNIQKPLIKKYRGKWLKEMGDGILASFNNSSDAVRCAGEIQYEAEKEGIGLRIGIHEGEVVFEGGDVLGDGVNVASRLEEVAQEGGINISGAVYRDIKNKAGISTEFIEERNLKNVDEPIKIYKVSYSSEEIDNNKIQYSSARKLLSKWSNYIIVGVLLIIVFVLFIWKFIPMGRINELEKTIAVLPIKNLSGDKNLEYMCDGLTEEIIFHISLIKDFSRVISSNSVMTLKNSSYTTPEIGQLLNVNYVIDGSYRQSNDLLKINIHLIETKGDDPIWSEVYQYEIGNILELQENIAKDVARKLSIELTEPEEVYLAKKPTSNIKAYTLLKKAEYFSSFFINYDEAERIFKQVIELDSNYSDAYALLACNYLYKATDRGNIGHEEAVLNAVPLIEKSLELDPNNYHAYYAKGVLKFWHEWDFINGEIYLNKVIELNSNYINAYSILAELYTCVNKDNTILVNKMVEIDPLNLWTNAALYYQLLRTHQKEKAYSVLKSNLELYDELFYVDAINYYLKEGNLKEAKNYFTKLNTYINQLKGTLNAKDLFHQILMNDIFKKPDDSKVYVEELKRRCDYPSFGNPNYYMAKYYCHCDSIENAFKYLERAYKNHEADLIWLKVDEDLFVLHDDPRYSELYTKIGFKAYDEYIEKEGIAFSTLQ